MGKMLRAAGPTPGRVSGPGRQVGRTVAHRLGTAIVAGEYAPGDLLSGEIEFSEALAVSRGAYREALKALAAKGLVESRTRAGTRVLPRARWSLLDPDVLAWAFSGEPDRDFVRSLFELREIVEPGAARLAAARHSPDELQTMADALAAMRRHSLGTEAGRAADCLFHDTILRATGNDALVTLSAGIKAAVGWTTLFKHRQDALPRDPLLDHQRVFDAIAERSPDRAAAEMLALVSLAFDDTRRAMKA